MRATFAADTFISAAEVAPLPQEFSTFERASAFAELRGWSKGDVMMNHDSDAGLWRVYEKDDPDCGCAGATKVLP